MKKHIHFFYFCFLIVQLSCQQNPQEKVIAVQEDTATTSPVERKDTLNKKSGPKQTVVGSEEANFYLYNWPDTFFLRSNGITEEDYQTLRVSAKQTRIGEIKYKLWSHAFSLALGETGYKIAGFNASRNILNEQLIEYNFETSSHIFSIKISPAYEQWLLDNFSDKKPNEAYEYVRFPETYFPLTLPAEKNKIGVTFKFNTEEKDGIPYTDIILQLTNFDLITFNEIKLTTVIGKPENISKFKESFQAGDTIVFSYWFAGQGGTLRFLHQTDKLVFEQLPDEEIDMETAEKIERGEIEYPKPSPQILFTLPIPDSTNLSFVRYMPMCGS